MARLLIEGPTIVLPNLSRAENAMPEFVQADCTPGRLADTLAPLVTGGPERAKQLDALARIDQRMSLPDGDEPSRAAARIALGARRALCSQPFPLPIRHGPLLPSAYLAPVDVCTAAADVCQRILAPLGHTFVPPSLTL